MRSGLILLYYYTVSVAEYKYENLKKRNHIHTEECYKLLLLDKYSYWKSFVHIVSVLLAIGVAR